MRMRIFNGSISIVSYEITHGCSLVRATIVFHRLNLMVNNVCISYDSTDSEDRICLNFPEQVTFFPNNDHYKYCKEIQKTIEKEQWLMDLITKIP